MQKIENTEVSYKEIMVTDSDPDKHSCDVLGIRDDGRLLLIREQEAHAGSACSAEREFFLIDDDEYFNFLGAAAKNLRLQRSLSRTTIIEVRYKGRYFTIGSPISYIMQHRALSVFMSVFDDSAFAEENGFRRSDKFEYERSVRIKDCESVRITHKDAADDSVLMQLEISSARFEEWLDAL